MKIKQGFTLIEILIYSAIITGILTVSLFTAYQLISSEERVVMRRELTENQKFVLQKLAWILTNVSAINSPAASSTGSTLSVNRLNYSYNPLVLSLSDGALQLTSGATVTPITNHYASVTALSFEHRLVGGASTIKVNAIFSNDAGSTTINTTIFVK